MKLVNAVMVSCLADQGQHSHPEDWAPAPEVPPVVMPALMVGREVLGPEPEREPVCTPLALNTAPEGVTVTVVRTLQVGRTVQHSGGQDSEVHRLLHV
jgi:hypothetical protein